MKALTLRMLEQSGIDAEANPAIALLADFAAQRSGVDYRNYYSTWSDRDGRNAYQTEIKDISADLRRFREALNIAASEGVTDADVIAEAPHAFSGRLTWNSTIKSANDMREGIKMLEAAAVRDAEVLKDIRANYQAMGRAGAWNYCTGQYFPTEYRKAAATLLEHATRRVRQARPKESAERITTIAQLKALAERNGSCWFDRGSMRFFRTRIESGIIRSRYFITSEQREDDTPRNYTIRSFNSEGDVKTVGEFHGHSTKGDALEALREHLKAGAPADAEQF